MNTEFFVDVYVADIGPHVTTADVLYIEAAAGAVDKNTYGLKICRYTVHWHRHGQCNAEIDDDGTDPGIGIERVIRETELVTVIAGKSSDINIRGSWPVFSNDMSELFSFYIIPGKWAAACGAYGVPGKRDPFNCRDRALDDIGHNRKYAGLSHVMRASRDPGALLCMAGS